MTLAAKGQLLLVVLVSAWLGHAATRLDAEYDPRDFRPREADFVALSLRAEMAFGADDRLAVVALLAPELFTAERLAALDAFTRALGRVPGLERVVSLTNAHTLGTGDAVAPGSDAPADPDDAAPIELRPLVPALPATDADAAALGRALRADPDVARAHLAREGSGCLVRAWVRESHMTTARRAAVRDALEAALVPLRAAGFDASVGGFPMMRVDYTREVSAQTGRLFVACLGVLALVLYLLLGRVRAAAAALAVVALANVWTHGAMALCGQRFTILGMLTPILVMVASVSDAMHLLHHHTDAGRGAGPAEARLARVRATVREQWLPCLVTSVTTAVGFLSLAWTDVPMLRAFGLFTALGVMAAFVVSFLVLPPLLALGWLGDVAPRPWLAARFARFEAWHDGVLGAVFARPRRALALGAAVCVPAAVAAAFASTDARVVEGLPPAHPVMHTLSVLERHFGVGVPMQVVYESDRPGALTEPAVVRHMAETARHLRALPEVGDVASADEVLTRLRALLGHGRTLPDDAAELGELFFAASLLDPDPLRPFFAEGERLARIPVQLLERGVHATLATQAQLEAELASRPLPGVRVGLAGSAYTVPRAWRAVQRDAVWGLVLAVGSIALLFGVLFRSARLSLAAIPPNALPLLFVLAAMSCAGIAFKGNNALCFSIAYGVAVDDTIHLLARLLERSRAGDAWPAAVARAYREVRRPMCATGFVLAAGFAVFLAGSFEFSVTLGVQMVVAVTTALVADLLLLPAILALRGGRANHAG